MSLPQLVLRSLRSLAALGVLAWGASAQFADQCYTPPQGSFITKRISNVGPNGEDGILGELDKGASHPSISNDEQWVVWDSGFENHPEGYNGFFQVRVSSTAGKVVAPSLLISRTPSGAPGNGHSNFADISGTGRYIAFPSTATNLASFGGGPREVFVADRDPLGDGLDGRDFAIARASESLAGEPSGGFCKSVSISADGQYVTFSVEGTPQFHPLANGRKQVYRKNMFTGELKLVSQVGGVAGDAASTLPDISFGGKYVVFSSRATNLPLGDGTTNQVYLADCDTGEITIVSTPDGGTTPGNGGIVNVPSVSDDGGVVFSTLADNLDVDGDVNNIPDVFYKPLDGPIERLSVDRTGKGVTNGYGFFNPVISGDESVAAFTYGNARDNDLTRGDSRGQPQLFARDILAKFTKMMSTADRCGLCGSENPNIPDHNADFTGGNTELPFPGLTTVVPFMTLGNNLDPNLPQGDTNDERDVYLHVIEW